MTRFLGFSTPRRRSILFPYHGRVCPAHHGFHFLFHYSIAAVIILIITIIAIIITITIVIATNMLTIVMRVLRVEFSVWPVRAGLEGLVQGFAGSGCKG